MSNKNASGNPEWTSEDKPAPLPKRAPKTEPRDVKTKPPRTGWSPTEWKRDK